MLDCIDKLENFNFKKLIEVAIKENFESELVNDWICNLYYRFDNLTNFNIGFYILLHKDEIIKKRKSNFRFELDSRHKIDKSSSEECKLELQNNFLQIDIFDYLNEFNDANHFWVCIGILYTVIETIEKKNKKITKTFLNALKKENFSEYINILDKILGRRILNFKELTKIEKNIPVLSINHLKSLNFFKEKKITDYSGDVNEGQEVNSFLYLRNLRLLDEEEEKRKQAEKEEEDRRIKKEVQDKIDEKRRLKEEEEERDRKEKKRLENEMYEKNKVLWKEIEKNYDYQNNWIKDIINRSLPFPRNWSHGEELENILYKLNIINFKTLYNYSIEEFLTNLNNPPNNEKRPSPQLRKFIREIKKKK